MVSVPVFFNSLSAALLTLTAVTAAAQAPGARVAILRDELPGLDAQLVDSLSQALTEAGHAVTPLTADELASQAGLSPERFDALLLTDSPRFPLPAREGLLRFLEQGGDLVLMGGHAFSEPLVKYGGAWMPPAELSRRVIEGTADRQTLYSFDEGDLSAWTRGSDRMEQPTSIASDVGVSGQAMRIEIRNAQWYDVYWQRLKAAAPGHNAVCLWAKGDLETPQLFIEITENDGSRWSRAVDVGPEWRAAVLPEGSFLFKKDGSPEGRGGEGDHLNLAEGRRLTLGLARDRTPVTKGDHTLWVDEIGTLRLDDATVAETPEPVGLPVFSDYEPYTLRDVVRVEAAKGQDIVPKDIELTGSFEGTWALGFAFPNQSRFRPVLVARDEHGRDRGWAAGMLANFAGQYAGSNWLIFGVTSPEFYRDPGFAAVVSNCLAKMQGDELARAAQAENERLDATEIALTEESPAFLRLSEDGRHFVDAEGQRVFLTGCNYIGSFARRFFGGPWLHYLEQDFQKAHAAGINAMRIYGGGALITDARKREALCQLARKYGIYLLIVAVDHTDILTEEALRERVRMVAEAFRDEPMVLGYDLQNEPYTYKVAEIVSDGGGKRLGERYPGWRKWEEYLKWAGLEVKTGNDFSTFPGLDGPLPVNDEWREVFDDTNAIWDEWVRWQVEEIRGVDPNHFVTVGYNSLNECFPANRRLDFVSHHVYRVPYSHEDVVLNLTTLDRVQAILPDRPVSLGEFGYSNGDVLDDGYLDFHTSAVGEMIHYLYAFANDFEGVHKWVLNDHPLALSVKLSPWMPPDATSQHVHQGRFGFYYYDGTIEGRPKPICHALRFFRDYADTVEPGGELEVTPGPTRIGTVYRYRGPGALFVGNVTYESPRLRFTAKRPANVMLTWNEDEARVMSTADATAWVRVGEGEMTRVELLEGETVVLQ